MVFGLALVMALVLGVASVALGANGQSFILGKLTNAATKVTGLVGNADGAALRVTNPNGGANDTALDLRVQAGEAPMRVNSPTKVANLNADQPDGKDAPLWAVVTINGALVRGNGAISTSRPRTGLYEVVFDKNVSQCAYTATIGGGNHFFPPPGAILAGSSEFDPNKVRVITQDFSGNYSNRDFHLTVNC